MPQITANLITRPSDKRIALQTRHELQRAADSGSLEDARHLELIEGRVIRRVTQNGPHALATTLTMEALRNALPKGFFLRVQMPLAIDDYNQPEPDVAVIRGSARDYPIDHPTTAELVVEIAYSSLIGDRSAKAGLYARAGVSEYWVVNLRESALEVNWEPALDPTAPFVARYQYKRSLFRMEEISPLFAPTLRLRVEDLLP